MLLYLNPFIWEEHNFSFGFYEPVLLTFLIISIIVVLLSCLTLIIGGIISFNRKDIIRKEVIYLCINLILLYIVTFTSLYLYGQTR